MTEIMTISLQITPYSHLIPAADKVSYVQLIIEVSTGAAVYKSIS